MNPANVEQLVGSVAGRVVTSEDTDYDEVRSLWNGMIDRRPQVIVQCGKAEDAIPAIHYARERGLPLAIRGAGHNIAGNAMCDDGVVIDFSELRSVSVDADDRRVIIEPGATLGDIDAATQPHGLAVPLGINSTTGVAGLTLGGGFGWLTRRHGMTVDNLLAANVVLASGEQVRASTDENPELFWALRGGGGNFGAVTRFEFRAHPIGPEVYAGLLVFPAEQANTVLTRYRDFVAEAPETLTVWVVQRQAPPLPFLPEDVHGRNVVVLALCYTGLATEGESLVAPLKEFGEAYGTHLGIMPFAEWQQAFDPLLTRGARNYWKTHNFTHLAEDALSTFIGCASALPSPQCEIFIAHIAGAANRVAADAMAYGHRDAQFVMNVHGRWDNAADDGACVGWTRSVFQATQPFASAGAYINFMTEDESARVENAFGDNLARLQSIKARYDGDNLFHLNQNIAPQ